MISNIIAKLYQETKIRIVEANQLAPKPPLPHGVYNITSPYIDDVGMEDVSYTNADSSLQEKMQGQYKITVSFNFYASSNFETIDVAKQVRQWFLFFGQEFIQSQNIAVVSIGNIENRTTFLVDSYEYKYGFDVQLRLSEELLKDVDYFDRVGE